MILVDVVVGTTLDCTTEVVLGVRLSMLFVVVQTVIAPVASI